MHATPNADAVRKEDVRTGPGPIVDDSHASRCRRARESTALVPHPEGGFYRETWRSPVALGGLPRGPRPASTAIYFLLPAGTFSAFHRVASDEAWHHYDGDPLDLHTIDDGGTHAVVRLGRDFARDERPQHVVPAGTWQAAVPRGERYTLVGCTVAPGFDFADFEMPPREDLVGRFPAHSEIVAQLTRTAR
jgi:predicted cupin superfamily sugar epimerase